MGRSFNLPITDYCQNLCDAIDVSEMPLTKCDVLSTRAVGGPATDDEHPIAKPFVGFRELPRHPGVGRKPTDDLSNVSHRRDGEGEIEPRGGATNA
jgi:hypothetical protein